ncbi:DsbA family protein [Nanoarchaeota archaeon]
MKKKKGVSTKKFVTKDRIFAAGALVLIVLLGIVMVNIDKIFPTPKQEIKLPTMPTADYDSLVSGEGALERGTNPDASVLVEEFSDFQCPFCKNGHAIVKQLLQIYGDDINVVFKHFPLSQMHPDAQLAAEATECARDQAKFWEMHDMLFANQYDLSRNNLKRYADSVGLDRQQFDKCLDSREKKDIVLADLNEGISRGVQGTPTFMVNGKPIPGANLEAIRSLIEQEFLN